MSTRYVLVVSGILVTGYAYAKQERRVHKQVQPAIALVQKKSDIAIVSLYDDGYKDIGIYSDKNKKQYALEHGYDLFIYHEKLDKSRPTAWSKIIAIHNHVRNYKWIFWSDSDAAFANKNIKLESLIDDSYNLIITREACAQNLNTGNFLIKNCAWSIELLKDMYNQKQFIFEQGYWEQKALAYLLASKPQLLNHVKILHQRTMNSHVSEPGGEYQPGDFIIHFYGPVDKKSLMTEWYYKTLNS